MIVRHCDANAQEDRVEPRLQVGQRHFAVDDKDFDAALALPIS